jgi:uncharacterized protein YhfF
MNEIQSCWEAYLASLPIDTDPARRSYTAWSFGDGKEMADELGELVRRGLKTATCSLLWEAEADHEPLPAAGDLSIILNGDGQPLCIIETTEVAVRPFNEVDERFAYEEGEGDRSLDYWRQEHWRYFSRICARLGREPAENMPLICERFRRVYPQPGATLV